MKMSIFGMLLVLVALTVGPLIYFNGGTDFFDDLFSKTSSRGKAVVYRPAETPEKVEVFKWKDENGVWQFGNAPPPGTAGVQSMTLQPNVNVMKAIDIPEVKQQEQRSGIVRLGDARGKDRYGRDTKKEDGVGISKESLENPYAPESISELLNSSQNIQKMLNNRQQRQLEAGGR